MVCGECGERYDVPADGYRELYGEEQLEKYRLALGFIDLSSRKVLDVGCGIGLLAEYLGSVNKDIYYVGVDVDIERLRAADRSLGDYVAADGHFLPFRDKAFDASLSFTVIHLLRLDDAIDEMRRVSRSLIVVTLLKKRDDLREKLLKKAEETGRVVEVNSPPVRDRVFLIVLE